MTQNLKKAVEFRSKGEFIDAENLFKLELKSNPVNPEVYYHLAWLYDKMNREIEASKKYEKALKLGIKGENLKGCLLGLGSTYRNIGKHSKALKIFEQAQKLYPKSSEFLVFKALTLFDLNQKNKSVELLLEIITKTTKDKGIETYKEAIKYYAKEIGKGSSE